MSGRRAQLEFIYTPLFEASIQDWFNDEDMRQVEQELLEDPQRGPTIGGTGGLRKLRAPMPGRGKSGGARIIYFHVPRRQRVYLLLGYPKNRKVNVSQAEKKMLRALARKLESEI